MLSEESIVLDRVTQAADLLSKIVSAVVHMVQSLRDLAILLIIVVELNRARVDVRVLVLPHVLLGLERLELLASHGDGL